MCVREPIMRVARIKKGTGQMDGVSELRHKYGTDWKRSQGAEYVDLINPATSEKLARVPLGTKDDIDHAVQAAAAAYPEWRRTPPEDRIQYLFKLKQILEDHVD